MKVVVVPFEEKAEFKELCRSLNIVYKWEQGPRWHVDVPYLPHPLLRWAPSELNHTHVLSCSFHERPFAVSQGAKWLRNQNLIIFDGPLPQNLRRFKSPVFSFQNRVEIALNQSPAPFIPSSLSKDIPNTVIHSKNAIIRAYHARFPAFLLAHPLHSQKTLTAWKAATEISDLHHGISILIVSPPSEIEHWRRTILHHGTGGHTSYPNDITIVDYNDLKLFFKEDENQTPQAKTTKGLAKFATPETFHLIIFDESQELYFPKAAKTKLAQKLTQHALFTLYISAVASTHPLHTQYLHQIFAHNTHSPATQIQKHFKEWLQEQGFSIRTLSFGRTVWTPNPGDRDKLKDLLFTPPKNSPPIAIQLNPPASDSQTHHIPLPLPLNIEDTEFHNQHWALLFEKYQHHILQNKKLEGIHTFLIQLSKLRSQFTIFKAQTLLSNRLQVAICINHVDTLSEIKTLLSQEDIQIAEYSIASIANHTAADELLRFTRQNADILLYTHDAFLSAAQSLLSALPPQSSSDRPTAQIIHDLLFEGAHANALPNAHHNPSLSSQTLTYYPFFEDSIEQSLLDYYLKPASLQTFKHPFHTLFQS